MRRRVELLPQSKAAIASATNVHDLEYFNVQGDSDELSDGVFRAHQIVGQMGVQALHSQPGSPHPPAGLGEITLNGGRPATPRVVIVSSLKFRLVHECLKAMDSALTLETTHRRVQRRIDQPKQSGHRRPVAQMGLVLNHHRSTVSGAHDHRETPRQGTTDQPFNEKLIVKRGVAKRQRQNSSVRTKRETNPWLWRCVE